MYVCVYVCMYVCMYATIYRNKRKCRIGTGAINFQLQANITLNISTNYILQLAIEADSKRPTVYSYVFTASRNIIYCLLRKPYFKGLCIAIDDMQIGKEVQ